jgi:hypothetical protein
VALARRRHAPVILFPGELSWSLNEFRNENWVDAFGYGLGQNADEDSLKWLVSGPLVHEWKNLPGRPLIQVLPPFENSLANQNNKRINSDDLRWLTWESLLLVPPAGVSYGAAGVVNWDTTLQPSNSKAGASLPFWQISLFLPGAKHLSTVAEVFNTSDIWRLNPVTRFVTIQPGTLAPRRHIAAAESAAKDFSATYVPEDRTVEVFLSALPVSPVIQWLNPRTGEKKSAVAVVGSRTCQFPTPDTNDWLLIMKSGK